MADTVRTTAALQALLADGAAAHSTNRQLIRDMLVSLDFRGLPVFNALGYGAVGDDTVDDTVAVQSAIDAATTAGGGIVLCPKKHFLGTSYSISGIVHHLSIVSDNVSLVGLNSRASVLRSATANAAIAHITGAGKPAGIGSWASYEARDVVDTPIYTLSGSYTRGVASLTLATAANASNFAIGDLVLIRTGQTIAGNNQPDAEINEIAGADGGTGILLLRRPTAKPYAQEYYIAGTSGVTSTTPTANLAPYGVAKITDRMLRNIAIERLGFDSTGNRHALVGGNIDGLSIRDCRSINTGKGLQSMGCYRDAVIRDNVSHTRGTGAYTYAVSVDSGCTDVTIDNNTISGERVVYLHVHEGPARISLTRNRLLLTPSGTANENAISIRARAYDIKVLENTVVNAGATPAIYVDAFCPGGGIISQNHVQGTGMTAAISSGSENWRVSDNDIQSTTVTGFAGAVYAPMERLTAWVYFNGQNPRLGVLPQHSYVSAFRLQVTTAFDSDGTDLISCGYDAAPTVIFTGTDVSTTGVKAPTAGTLVGYNSVERDLEVYYTPGGSQPTVGKAIVVVEFYRVNQRT